MPTVARAHDSVCPHFVGIDIHVASSCGLLEDYLQIWVDGQQASIPRCKPYPLDKLWAQRYAQRRVRTIVHRKQQYYAVSHIDNIQSHTLQKK